MINFLKSFCQYLAYRVSLRPLNSIRLLVDTTLLILIIFQLRASFLSTNNENDFLSISILIFASFKFIYSSYKLFLNVKAFTQVKEISIKKSEEVLSVLSDLSLSKVERANDFKYKSINLDTGIEYYTFSSIMNSRLINSEIDWEIITSNRKLEEVRSSILSNESVSLSVLAYKVRQVFSHDQMFFNEAKISIGNDFYDKHVCEIYKSTYFDSVVTNELSHQVIKKIDTNKILFNGISLFPMDYDPNTDKPYLLEISFSKMNDHIGISTIGFTKDNYLIFRHQSGKSEQSPNLLVPTASGSINFKDKRNNSLKQTVVNGMLRELSHENKFKNLVDVDILTQETLVIGYFRWVRRGGKPEFIGLTKLNIESNQIAPDGNETFEPDKFHRQKIDSIDDLYETCKSMLSKPNISLSLAVTFESLSDTISNNRELVSSYLNLK